MRHPQPARIYLGRREQRRALHRRARSGAQQVTSGSLLGSEVALDPAAAVDPHPRPPLDGAVRPACAPSWTTATCSAWNLTTPDLVAAIAASGSHQYPGSIAPPTLSSG